MDFGTVTVPGITAICYLLGMAIKTTENKNLTKWIPVACMTAGGILWVLAMSTVPGLPAADVISAILVGIGSGGLATGMNQAARQLGGS